MSTELLWALRIAECKIIFTDLAALPLVEETLKSFEGHKPVIYIMEYESKLGKISGYKTHLDLMSHGEMDWQPIRGSEATSKRCDVILPDNQSSILAEMANFGPEWLSWPSVAAPQVVRKDAAYRTATS